MNSELSMANAGATRKEPAPPSEHAADQFSVDSSPKCLICNYSIVGQPFCKIHNVEGGSALICCPDCLDQYLEAARGPRDLEEQERRSFVARLEAFIGVDNLPS